MIQTFITRKGMQCQVNKYKLLFGMKWKLYIEDSTNTNNAELITLQPTARYHFLIIINDWQTRNEKLCIFRQDPHAAHNL